MNAFKTLGIEPRLVIAEEAVRDAFREAGKLAHPDAGGAEESFAKLREAFEIVSSPSRRLRHWLGLRGIAAETRGTVDSAIMDLFARVGETSQRAEELVRKRDQSKSALARALLERDTQSCREEVERAIMMVETAIGLQCATFPDYESAPSPDQASASTTVRNLAFLEKWRATLRGVFSRLV
jgi:curved DNA-binding protein CbpA